MTGGRRRTTNGHVQRATVTDVVHGRTIFNLEGLGKRIWTRQSGRGKWMTTLNYVFSATILFVIPIVIVNRMRSITNTRCELNIIIFFFVKILGTIDLQCSNNCRVLNQSSHSK